MSAWSVASTPRTCTHNRIVTFAGENYGLPPNVYGYKCGDCGTPFHPEAAEGLRERLIERLAAERMWPDDPDENISLNEVLRIVEETR